MPEAVSGAPPPRFPDALPNNLPHQLSSFVGRESELREIGRLLYEHRLFTLTGAGGCGKSRLAVEVASEALEHFPDGAWWVELAPLADERLVGAAIAEALGVRPLPGMTELQAAGAYLASRRALVVLDNCEHLLEPCARAAEALLDAAPEVVVMATSRAPLAASGETAWPVPSLSLPDDNRASDAVALFTERAAEARPALSPTADDIDAVAQICTELEGMPLAIELAAARVRILSIRQVAAELSARFRLLSGGPSTATPRLRALRASVDWSHELLSDAERVLLRRLSVFAGGFTLEAVDEVCAGDAVEREAVLDILASLVDQSLMIVEETGAGVRYRLLETVRQYSLERLSEAGEEDVLRGRHRDHFLALAELAAPHLETGRQLEFLELLDPEAANLSAAIDFALGTDRARALRLCAALYRWWHARGRLAEAELSQSRSLADWEDRDTELRARVLQQRSAIASILGAFEAAESDATKALALAGEVGDEATAARARGELGLAATRTNPGAARTELRRSAELASAANDQWALVQAREFIVESYIWLQEHAQARRALDEVADMAEQLGDPFQVAKRWWYPSVIALLDGRMAECREAAERTQAAVQAVGDPLMESVADYCLGVADVWQGMPERAAERLNSRLERAMAQGAAYAVPPVLAGIGQAELNLGRLEDARNRMEGLVPLVEGRWEFAWALALGILAEALRLQADDNAEHVARRARDIGEEMGNDLLATQPRLTLGRIAAAREDWTEAREQVLAHLDACVEGGHRTYVPGCLDALAEGAAGIEAHEDAVRLLAAAEQARAEIGIVRVPPEAEHWNAMDDKLRKVLGDQAYEAAKAQGAEMSTDDAVEWARRARGPRRRPPGGWDSLTPTELKVVELVAQGLTNPQVAERMFVAPSTVKTHLSHIYRKLEVHSRAELGALVARRGAGN
jgi:predicted ATPase/DNA-binding CsgD family transcriptional regulator